TGHLILTGRWIGLENGGGLKNEALDSFNVVIQIGAALAVAVLYWRRLQQVGVGLFRGDPDGRRLLGLLIVAFMPAAVVGLALHKRITEYLFFPLPVAGALVVGGVVMVGVELYRRRHAPRTTSLDAMTYRQALIIGLAQCLALWPGTSRSMTTIVAALLVGLSPLTAAEFSFLLALPVLTAAAGLEVVKDFDKLLLYAGPGAILVGLGVSALVAVLAVEAFVRWVSKHGMTPFGVYRIVVGLVVYWVLMR
ncbi:MAG TPA: undecaprenyl-diphosphate phosphatase, partial [Phycisphaerae bacterium]|nr:undecaprenyl-diphosphate phosphatase [Phycisphaerae bacterium]